jgi:hypothetical protein
MLFASLPLTRRRLREPTQQDRGDRQTRADASVLPGRPAHGKAPRPSHFQTSGGRHTTAHRRARAQRAIDVQVAGRPSRCSIAPGHTAPRRPRPASTKACRRATRASGRCAGPCRSVTGSRPSAAPRARDMDVARGDLADRHPAPVRSRRPTHPYVARRESKLAMIMVGGCEKAQG